MSLYVRSLPHNPPLKSEFNFHQLIDGFSVDGVQVLGKGFTAIKPAELENAILLPSVGHIKPHPVGLPVQMDVLRYGMPFFIVVGALTTHVLSSFYSHASRDWHFAIPIPGDIGFDSSLLKENAIETMADDRFSSQFGLTYFIHFIFNAMTCWGVTKQPSFDNIRLRRGRYIRNQNKPPFPEEIETTVKNFDDLTSFPYIEFRIKQENLAPNIIWNPSAAINSKVRLVLRTESGGPQLTSHLANTKYIKSSDQKAIPPLANEYIFLSGNNGAGQRADDLEDLEPLNTLEILDKSRLAHLQHMVLGLLVSSIRRSDHHQISKVRQFLRERLERKK